MTFWDFFEKHRQLISGRIIVGLMTVETLHLSGAFHGLVSESWERWLGIAIAVAAGIAGNAVSGRAKETTAQVTIATAMQTAIQTPAGDPLPPEVTKLATPPESKP